MRSVGIICEYNPLHKGHAYHIERAKEHGVVVCIMSGNFTQRGEAAVLPPVSRAGMALSAGADLVVELPFPYAASSARFFATAGVRAAAGLGCDALCFGCEEMDVATLKAKAVQMGREETVREDYREGIAAAHFEALGEKPLSNDILALEYARAVCEEFPDMALYPVRRLGNAYNDKQITTSYPSASALREILATGGDVSDYIPHDGVKIWQDALARYGVADVARLAPAMLARLRVAPLPKELADLGGGLVEHLAHAACEATTYESLCRAAATKRYTDGRIRRALLYLLAGVTYNDLEAPPAYLRLLAANARGREYLATTRKTRTVPVVTKQSDVTALGDVALRARELSAISDALYALTLEKPTLPATLAVTPPFMTE